MSASAVRSTTALYQAFMGEIKSRLDEIGFRLDVIKQDPSSKTAIFEAESAYLQTRFVCELVALASLAAHHSYGLKKSLLSEWHADTIFSELEEINPHCFPVPVTNSRDAEGVTMLTPTPGRRMRRTDLKAMYGQCGDALHRGKIKHALAGKTKVYDTGRLGFWLKEFLALLTSHVILLPAENRVLMVRLHEPPSGAVKVYEIQADGPFAVLFD